MGRRGKIICITLPSTKFVNAVLLILAVFLTLAIATYSTIAIAGIHRAEISTASSLGKEEVPSVTCTLENKRIKSVHERRPPYLDGIGRGS